MIEFIYHCGPSRYPQEEVCIDRCRLTAVVGSSAVEGRCHAIPLFKPPLEEITDTLVVERHTSCTFVVHTDGMSIDFHARRALLGQGADYLAFPVNQVETETGSRLLKD